MKKQHLFFAAVLAAFCFSSCQKEEKAITHFTAGMEQASCQQDNKTYLDGTLLKWVEGDQVKVFGTAGSGAFFSVTPRTDDATWAELEYVSGNLAFGPYKAIYPATLVVSSNSIMLPSTQFSADGNLSEFPMYAESTTDVFQFKNLCGALKIHLQQSDVTINRISIIANSNISGTYTIDASGTAPLLVYSANGSNSTMLYCTSAQDISAGHDFYIYLPAGTYNGLQLVFYQPDGSHCTKTGNVNVERSVCSNIIIGSSLVFSDPEPESNGRLPGLFSVAEGRQVYFSQGNLQWSATGNHAVNGGGTAPGTWRFAEHQYDRIGYDNANISSTYTGWIDLFGWGTSGYHNEDDVHNVNFNPYSSSWDIIVNEENNFFGYGPSNYMVDRDLIGTSANYDWGVYNAISNGGNIPNVWRTLTVDEWDFLLYTRNNASNKFAVGRIKTTDYTYLNGFIILPDEWTLPSLCSFTAGFSTQENDFSKNTYTESQWLIMESAGAIFLPAGGDRLGNWVNNMGSVGFYWSSSHGGLTACRIILEHSYIEILSDARRDIGYAVRLVQDNN